LNFVFFSKKKGLKLTFIKLDFSLWEKVDYWQSGEDICGSKMTTNDENHVTERFMVLPIIAEIIPWGKIDVADMQHAWQVKKNNYIRNFIKLRLCKAECVCAMPIINPRIP
jgi:hypothetical protein